MSLVNSSFPKDLFPIEKLFLLLYDATPGVILFNSFFGRIIKFKSVKSHSSPLISSTKGATSSIHFFTYSFVNFIKKKWSFHF